MVVVGIDAGGTSVRVVVAHPDKVIGEASGPADAAGGPVPLASLLARALADAETRAADVQAACAGVTKVSRPGIVAAWEAELTRLLPHLPADRRLVVADFVIAFEGAIGGARPALPSLPVPARSFTAKTRRETPFASAGAAGSSATRAAART
jgi:N-acetylglucosamine kinase-like BadF-type ATPase